MTKLEPVAAETPYYRPTTYDVTLHLANTRPHKYGNVERFPVIENGFITIYTEDGFKMYRESEVVSIDYEKVSTNQ